MTNERRKAKRFKLHQLIKVSFGREEIVAAEGLNISATGILCKTKLEVEPLCQVYVMVVIPEGNSERIIENNGCVVRSSKIKNNEYEVGIEFVDLLDADRIYLEQWQ